MLSSFRILIVEDHPAHAERVVEQLRHAGFTPAWIRVDCENEFLEHLDPTLDLIFMNCAARAFATSRAIDLLHERGLDIPIIIVTDPANEPAALACLDLGAADYLLADRLARLEVIVRRALHQHYRPLQATQAGHVLGEQDVLHRAMLRSLTAHLAVLDQIGTVVAVNKPWDATPEDNMPTFARLTLGCNYLTICRAVSGAYAATARQIIAGIEAVLTDPQKRFAVEYLSHKAGEDQWFVLDITPLNGERRGVMIAHKEITKRKQIEQALSESEERFRLIAENTSELISLVDQEGQYLYVSPSFRSMLGYDPAELIGAPAFALVHPDDLAILQKEWAHFVSEGTGHVTVRYRQSDGIWRWIEASGNAVQKRDRFYMVGVGRDITKRKQAEEALAAERALLERRIKERTADLSAANAELARAARLKDEFLANMSHELRTPLNAILGLSEALQEAIYGELSERQAKTMQSIVDSGHHLLSLINDILDLSKIEAGKLILDIDNILLTDVCHSSLQFIRHAAHKKGITVSVSFDEAVTTLQADARRLKQILVNLLSNAVKFTPEGGVVGLQVAGDPNQHVVDLTIWDTGIGIPPNDLARLFQPFVQLDSRLSRQYEGTGLGLVLVARMAEMHGGSVTVTSVVGQGSRFKVRLPWSGPTDADGTAPLDSSGAKAHYAFRRALIIDDSPTTAALVAHYLDEMGMQAVIHAHGSGVIARTIEVEPDLIILDILLPDASGWEILTQLKAEPKTQHIPVLIASVTDDQAQAELLGAYACLVKPFTRQDIHDVLQHLGSQPAADTKIAPPRPAAKPRHGAAPLVLLAEDNELNIVTLCDYLRAKGFEVVVARNGAEVISRAHEIRPNVILMDIQMPGMDGLTATRHIRSDPELAAIPVIALTALVMPGDRERCLEAGVTAYLSKPVYLSELYTTIQKHLAV